VEFDLIGESESGAMGFELLFQNYFGGCACVCLCVLADEAVSEATFA
jgi:hypothetical protein